MSRWPATKAKRVLAALLRNGWTVKREASGCHRTLARPGWPDVVFAFHDSEEIGPRMLGRIAKRTGLKALIIVWATCANRYGVVGNAHPTKVGKSTA